MKISRTPLALCATVVFAACASTQGAEPQTAMSKSHCGGLSSEELDVASFYSDQGIQRVEPLYLVEDRGPAPNTRAGTATRSRYLAGATMYVPAQRESSAYVERVLSCHAAMEASSSDHPNDPLRVKGIRSVDVRQAGPALSITIAGGDADTGRSILQRAEALRSQPTSVEVKQLSAVSGSAAAL